MFACLVQWLTLLTICVGWFSFLVVFKTMSRILIHYLIRSLVLEGKNKSLVGLILGKLYVCLLTWTALGRRRALGPNSTPLGILLQRWQANTRKLSPAIWNWVAWGVAFSFGAIEEWVKQCDGNVSKLRPDWGVNGPWFKGWCKQQKRRHDLLRLLMLEYEACCDQSSSDLFRIRNTKICKSSDVFFISEMAGPNV